MPSLSVTIITKNEADNIKRCLESVKWADEIIIVDSGSTDNTLDICAEYTDKIYKADWEGFGIQKNRALEKASGEWVLSIDADEVVTTELRNEIQQILQNPDKDSYIISRRLVFQNQILKGGETVDSVLRLFKRSKGKFTNDIVHEKIVVDGSCRKLENFMLHYSFKNIDALLHKMNTYSTYSATMKYQSGKRGNVFRGIFASLWMFIRCYFIKRGFLDGKAGLVFAVSFAEGSFYRYMKLCFMG